MALVGVELETFVSEPDALTTRPPPVDHPRCQRTKIILCAMVYFYISKTYLTMISLSMKRMWLQRPET